MDGLHLSGLDDARGEVGSDSLKVFSVQRKDARCVNFAGTGHQERIVDDGPFQSTERGFLDGMEGFGWCEGYQFVGFACVLNDMKSPVGRNSVAFGKVR